jgi:hypothetical protein
MTETPPTVQYLSTAIEGKFPGVITDLHSIQGDLAFARDCAVAYLAGGAGAARTALSSEQALVARALWAAGVVAYRRAFAVGKGHIVPKAQRFNIKKLREQVFTSEQQAADDGLREMVDQYIAHRVSDHELSKMYVFLAPPPMPREIAALGPMVATRIGPPPEVAQQLVENCTVLLEPINHAINEALDQQRRVIEPDLDRLYEWAMRSQD